MVLGVSDSKTFHPKTSREQRLRAIPKKRGLLREAASPTLYGFYELYIHTLKYH
jgi:hypothetical protein